MTINIKGNLVLKKDREYKESIVVDGSIVCVEERFSLKVVGDISAGNISARDISARDISAWDISAWDISARDILARDISAKDISAGNISARDISAGNISAENISARDISYYAVAHANKNIVCTKIEGRRDKHKHFCLDGKITIKQKEARGK